MPKRELQDFEVWQNEGFAAIERKKQAEKLIVTAARDLDYAIAADMHRADVDLRHQALMLHVRAYNQAEADLKAIQDKLDARARARR